MLSIVICLLAVLFPFLYSRYGPFRYYTRMSLYFLIMTLVGIISIPPCMLHFKSPSNLLLPSSLLSRFTFMIGITFKVLNSERIRKTQRYIFVANHQTALDIAGMMTNWPLFHPCVPVMKKELLWTGPVGILCWMSGCVFVDRQNSERGRAALNEKLTVVSDGKCSLFIYPEGTRSQAAKMRRFKKGAFFMAIQCKVPIVPVVYSRYSNLVNEKNKVYESGAVTMTVLPEVSTAGMTATDVPALTEKVYDIMQSYLDKETADALLWGDPFQAEAPDSPSVFYCPTPSASGSLHQDDAVAGTSSVADAHGSGVDDKKTAVKAAVSVSGTASSQKTSTLKREKPPEAESSTKPKSKASKATVSGPALATSKTATEEKGAKLAKGDKAPKKSASNRSLESGTNASVEPNPDSSTARATGKVDRRSHGRQSSITTNAATSEQSSSSKDNTAQAQKTGSSNGVKGTDGGQRT